MSTAKLVAPLKPPVPLPSRIDTLSEPLFATARSWCESPSKRPIATEDGPSPAAKLVGPVKPPPAMPSRIDTLSEFSFATARSGDESPLNSPTATERGASPAAKLVGALKVTAWAIAGATAADRATPRSALPSHRSGDEILVGVCLIASPMPPGYRRSFGVRLSNVSVDVSRDLLGLPARPPGDSVAASTEEGLEMRRMLFAACSSARQRWHSWLRPRTRTSRRSSWRCCPAKPSQVSGGDALVRVTGCPSCTTLRVKRNGTDVTSAFSEQDGALVGLVEGLQLGKNNLTVHRSPSGQEVARLKLTNYPNTGPIFSGPHQEFFVCNTIQAGLGEPLVDNQDGKNFRVQNPDGSTAGWSRNCSANTTVDYLYRTTAGSFQPLPSDGSRPSNMAQTTLLDGRTVDYVVRRERGTINRFIYSFAMLAPFGEDPDADPDTSLWNKRAIFTFDGGVQIGHRQATPGGSALYDTGLSKGYGIIHSSGTRTSTHYNLVLGGETALMTKEEFIERYGVPLYTVGVGGSGGAIQQYVYGQNHSKLLDAGIPQYSYPDMVTQTIHVGDCELLERYMDVDDSSNPKWQNWDNREWLEGLNAHATLPNPYRRGAPGNSECVKGWRGLTPLALNPLWFQSFSGLDRMDPAEMVKVQWTHADDLKNIYGVGPDGHARNTYDNVGVQYGLKALTDGNITPQEFLKVNARVGSWKEASDMVQEAFPFPSPPPPMPPRDRGSTRGARATCTSAPTAAPRRRRGARVTSPR